MSDDRLVHDDSIDSETGDQTMKHVSDSTKSGQTRSQLNTVWHRRQVAQDKQKM